MMYFRLVYLHFLLMVGVIGAESENIETVSVMLGESVTLHTDRGEIKRYDHILWMFGSDSPSTRIAEIIKWSYMFSMYICHKEPFRDQLQLDRQTGSLTIGNISMENSGNYKLTIVNNRMTSRRRFYVKVYAPLPVPVMISDSSLNSTLSERSSGSKCVVMCSVRNVSWVTLSFYRGNDLLSNISGSDVSTELSLSLEVEYNDENIYSCVVNNFNSNQTAHIDVTHLCQSQSESSLLYCLLLLLIPFAVSVTVWILYVHRKRRKAQSDENS